MGWEVGERFKRERTDVYVWLIHVDGWQKPTQHCKATILQLKKKKTYKDESNHSTGSERGDVYRGSPQAQVSTPRHF